MPDHNADFGPTAAWPALRLRAELLRRTRRFFDEQGFLEVETPLLSADVVVDRHLDPFATTLCDDPRTPERGQRLWLQTSPEFGMKRLLAAGAPSLYQITRAFRNAERGRLHNPEFTILEWYGVGDSYSAGMTRLSQLCEALLALGPAEQVAYGAAFQRHVGIDPHTASVAEMDAAARRVGVVPPSSLAEQDRDGWLNLLWAECVEPHLGSARPTIVYAYPASQAALAQVRDKAPPVAERFELYVRGVELANGYHELRDAAVLRARNHTANAQRRADDKPELPETSRLLAAMEAGLPDCTGVAIGFDRAVMLAAGASDLRDVLAFPIERA